MALAASALTSAAVLLPAHAQDSGVTSPDTTAPVLLEETGAGQVVAWPDPYAFSTRWVFDDIGTEDAPESGIAGYDARRRVTDVDLTPTEWQSPLAWQELDEASVETVAMPGETVCVSARARDNAGNVGEWTRERCTYVDYAYPVTSVETGSPRYVPSPGARLRYRYAAVDDYGIASYDVETRNAPRGEPRGPWTLRAERTAATSLTVRARPGSEWCFRFRAHDVAGNVSPWSQGRCSAVPVDDRGFSVPGSATRGFSRLAVGGTYTALNRRGSRAILPDQRGRETGVWLLAGPRQGVVDVHLGGRHFGRVWLEADRWHRRLVRLTPYDWTGDLRLTQVGPRSVRFDAAAVRRPPPPKRTSGRVGRMDSVADPS